jgi:hypothetical protein
MFSANFPKIPFFRSLFSQCRTAHQKPEFYGAELLSTTEVAHSAVARVTDHAAGKKSPGKKVHQLSKSRLASVHRRLQRIFLALASRQIQIDTTRKRTQSLAVQMVADSELVVNWTAMKFLVNSIRLTKKHGSTPLAQQC